MAWAKITACMKQAVLPPYWGELSPGPFRVLPGGFHFEHLGLKLPQPLQIRTQPHPLKTDTPVVVLAKCGPGHPGTPREYNLSLKKIPGPPVEWPWSLSANVREGPTGGGGGNCAILGMEVNVKGGGGGYENTIVRGSSLVKAWNAV